MRTRAIPQGRDFSSFASPNLPGTSCSTPSPSTPNLLAMLLPVALRYSAGASGNEEDEGGSEGVRDRGGRGEEVEERRGERNPE